jgi:predicted TIM-barrel fold metal-dependent hydrolase
VKLKHMDESGVAAEAIFAGHTNGETLPWAGPFSAGWVGIDPTLRALGAHIWNQWLADFVSAAPERLLGVMQIPIWDVDQAVKEIEWARDHGLRAINFPAPRPDYPAYNDAVYDPLWAVAQDSNLPLLTHVAAGDVAAGQAGRGGMMITFYEIFWLGRRNLQQLIFGGVFDRYPGLKLAYVEQGGEWVLRTLQELDGVYEFIPEFMPVQLAESSGSGVTLEPNQRAIIDFPSHSPSQYFADNCFVATSFMTPREVGFRHEVGLKNLLWGSDYPHVEGTWPNTKLALRNTFCEVPVEETRMILEDTGVRLFSLDTKALRPIADRIGPTPSELATPLQREEYPAYGGFAFRGETEFFS